MSILTTILFWVGILGFISFLFLAFGCQEGVFSGISVFFGLFILGSCICYYNFSYCPNCILRCPSCILYFLVERKKLYICNKNFRGGTYNSGNYIN